jgi:hypothetical protein
MKWAFVIFFIFNANSNCTAFEFRCFNLKYVQETVINAPENTLASISPILLLNIQSIKSYNLEDESIADFVAILLLYITTFLVVITPFILIYFWILFSYKYVKKFRRVFSIKKWFRGKIKLEDAHLNDSIWLSYRNVYAPMIGFGVAIIAYAFSSIRFMVLNFESMNTAMVQYFKFPFFVLDKFGWIQIDETTEMNIDFFWNQMLLVVVISGLFFLVGYLLGAILVDLRLKMTKKKIKNSPSNIAKLKENMFHLNMKKKQSIDTIL